MPTYEMPLVVRTLSKPEIFGILKRTTESIFEKGGIIRKIENLGTRQTPYKLRRHGLVEKRASYFFIQFDTSPMSIDDLREEIGRDIDIMRSRIYKSVEPEEFQCTIEDECLPPAYRQDVQKMMEIAKNNLKPKFNNNTNLDYYPFNK